MTTTISFVTRDCVVIGCDSLSTASRPMIDPYALINQYLSVDDDGTVAIKLDKDGNKALDNIKDLSGLIENVPYNQQANITKIYHLNPAKAGLLFSGIASIGDLSIKNLVDEFLSIDEVNKYLRESSYTIQGTATRLKDFIEKAYNEVFGDSNYKPSMEIIVSGYSKQHAKPEVYKVKFDQNGEPELEHSCKRGKYDIVFGGQHDIIERVVYGLDLATYSKYRGLVNRLIQKYHAIIEKILEENEIAVAIPNPDEIDELKKMVEERFWSGVGFSLANFSEQAAIDFVEFLVDVMIKSQQFSSQLPTVGGDIHMAIITKSGGFRWLSREEYDFQGNRVKKYED